jgi:hypothetical protein
MLFIALGIFTLFVFIASMRAGKFAGFGLTVVSLAAVAWIMPPKFSFRVSQTRDIIVLSFFGATALVLTQTAPSRQNAHILANPASAPPLPRPLEVDLENALADFTASDTGARLREAAAAIAVKGCALPCTAGETFRILSDTVNAALALPGVVRISIYAAQQPSAKRIQVVAHRVWPTPENAVVMIGQRDSVCVPIEFAGWPARAHANWFDNGYARIYQISVETGQVSIENGASNAVSPGA